VPEARRLVEEWIVRHRALPPAETVPLEEAGGRVLAEDLAADRDYPPLARSIRDGFAVRHTDVPGQLRLVGEVRAGAVAESPVGPGEAIEIMTGAPLPEGADAVVMVEYARREGERIVIERPAAAGEFVHPRGAEARAGDRLLAAGQRLDYARVALAAMIGRTAVRVYPRPRVAILATGDEIVDAGGPVADHQIRNSNSYSLAEQVRRAGGEPAILPVAKDSLDDTRRRIQQGLACDLLLLSGGVSAGKYDLVEPVLAELDAEFVFDRVLIQPGQPLVFGRARGKFFFGLPGNPASTMVTFELFARLAIELLGGQEAAPLPLGRARLTCEFRHRPGLMRFLPAWVAGGELTPIPWAGSSDIAAVARANAFLVAAPDRPVYQSGEDMEFLPR